MKVRVKQTVRTRDGVVCFTAGKVYPATEAFEYFDDGRVHRQRVSLGLVHVRDDRGEPSVLMFSEVEVTF